MTYIIIGLGNFGLALATKLTAMGHDVFGIDSHMEVVEEYKNVITSTMCLTVSDVNSLRALPLEDADMVIVTMSENVGNSLMVCALLKQAKVKKLVARASTMLHRTVLETMGIDQIITPESYAADLWALSSEIDQIKGAYLVSGTYQMLELEIPTLLEGQSLQEAKLEDTFKVKLMCVKRILNKENFLKANTTYYEVVTTDDSFKFAPKDHILVFGTNNDMNQLKKAFYK